MENIRAYIKDIKLLGHSSIKLTGSLSDNLVCYFDPWKLKGNAPADYIFISHDHHYDHFSLDDIKKILKPSSRVFMPKMLQGKLDHDVKILSPGDNYSDGIISIKAIRAYNTNKSFHPYNYEGLGYVVAFEHASIYFAGDTDLIPEMKAVCCDIAFLPVSGTYVMNAPEAAEAAKIIKPRLAIPMHYADIIGSYEDAMEFEKLCSFDTCLLLGR
ncbi:MAG: MBL fold metallo-hydrolase [Pseudomonadota bacterium]